MNSLHLMSATLNTKWLAWIVETPPKVYLHDQEMTEEGVDGTSIPLNPAKSKTIERGGGWL